MATLAQLAFGPNVSGAIGRGLSTRNTLNQTRAQDRQFRASEALDEAFAGGVPTDPARRAEVERQAFQTGGAQAGLQVRELFQNMNAQEREEAAREGRMVATVLAGVQDQGTYDRARAGLQGRGIDISSLPEQFDPGHRDFIVSAQRDLEDVIKSQQPGEGFTLGPKDIRFGPGGAEIARGAEASGTGTGVPTDAQFKQVNTLRDEFISQTKNFVAARDGFEKVQAAANDNTGAGDVALVFGFMKTVDPGSTVREGEFATAENTGSVDERVWRLYNSLRTGERLSPDQRQRFADTARSQFESMLPGYDQTVSEYTRIATNFGLDPANVIVNRVLEERVAETATPATSAPTPDEISRMTLEQLPTSVEGLSDEQKQALDRRLTELGF